MATIPPNTSSTSNLLTTHRALLDTLLSYLTVLTHHILYLRRLYPPVSFLSTRAYNYPVRQSRHPDVCAWINDAMLAVRDQLECNSVKSIALCIFECERNQVLERWVFDLHNLPVVAKRDRDVPFDQDEELRRKVNVVDLEASFRANLSRLGTVAGKLTGLPDGEGAPECSFTICVEVKDGADRPVGRLKKEERAWIVAEPDVFEDNIESFDADVRAQEGKQKQGSRTHAVRRLEAGELRMEIFAEEAADVKKRFPSKSRTTLEKSKDLSYGAGTEKFDPENGYELEDADIHRKMGGGANYTKG